MADTPIQTVSPAPPSTEGADSASPKTTTVKPEGRHRRWLLALLVLILVVAAGGAGYYIFVHPKHQVVVVKPVPHIPDATWLATPVTVADPGVFTDLENYYSDIINANPPSPMPKVSYLKVGSYYGKDIILANIPPVGPSTESLALFLKTDPKSYSLLKKYTALLYDSTDGHYAGPKLSPEVTIDTTTTFPSLNYQKIISVKGVLLKNGDQDYQVYSDWVDSLNSANEEAAPADKLPPLSVFASTKYGTLYTDSVGSGTGFLIQSYVLKMPDQETLEYQLLPPFISGSETVPSLTWSDGTTTKDPYRFDGDGTCGTGQSLAVLNDKSGAGLSVSGKTTQGEPVYSFTSSTNPTLLFFYNSYKDGYPPTDANGNPEPIESLSQFIANHAVFLYKDKLGRYIVFADVDLFQAGGCGKPVIYLYPTKPTNVSVSVGATITKSDPLYNNGWNVLAQPNGDLTWNGQHFDSLYWEGYSQNPYPLVTTGFVVKQTDLASTITSQLHQLGLTAKETNDFEAFWLSRLPKTPYVRLTWFGTQQMNELAPLRITPTPDTLIRVFLDYHGLQQPISIPAERLSAIPRRGFTVVEWGGELGEK